MFNKMVIPTGNGGGRDTSIYSVTLASRETKTIDFPNLKSLILCLDAGDADELLVMEDGVVTYMRQNHSVLTPSQSTAIIWVSYSNGVISLISMSGDARKIYVAISSKEIDSSL